MTVNRRGGRALAISASRFSADERADGTDFRQQGKARDDLYLAVAALFRRQAPTLSQHERTLMRDILRRLAGDVEMAIRIALAERLADDPTAPLDLILMLADDRIEVARPIILRSELLDEVELLSLVARADDPVKEVCAERPNIGEPVTALLAQSDAEPVLLALVRNATARIGADTFEALVEKSRAIAVLQEPLAKRPDLPVAPARRLCAFVSGALKAFLTETHRLDATRADTLVAEAARALDAPPRREPATGAEKLIDKLAAAGQLKPGFLLRVLQQTQYDLFDLGFARLLELEVEVFREIFYAKGPSVIALACRAVGIDRSVFSTVLQNVSSRRNRSPLLGPDDRIGIDRAFALTRPDAFARIRAVPFS